jgi:maleylacetate reductase
VYRGRVAFGAMEEVVFGRPAAGAAVEQIDPFGAAREFLNAGATRNREISEIKNAIRKMTPGIPRKIDGPAQIRETLLREAS